MAANSETESLHDNMTRIRMKMVQRKLANEREKLQRPESSSSGNSGQIKLQQALLRRQQLLDRLKLEQQQEDQRARSCSPRPRRRYTPSTLPPPSRRSLPPDLLRGMSRAYHFNWYNSPREREMPPQNYIIEHQYKQPPPPAPLISTRREVALPQIVHVAAPPAQPLPPPPPPQILHVTAPQPPPPPPPQQILHVTAPPPPPPPPPQITTIQHQPQVVKHVPSVTYESAPTISLKENGSSFNKRDFMDVMMLQNAQMHHMVMQQMMLQNLPGSCNFKMPTAEVPVGLAPMRPMIAAPAMAMAPPPPPPPPPQAPPAPVIHHMQTLPPLEPRYAGGSSRVYNNTGTFYDDGSNYFTYH